MAWARPKRRALLGALALILVALAAAPSPAEPSSIAAEEAAAGAGFATSCTTAGLRAVAASIAPRVTIGSINDGPLVSGGVRIVAAGSGLPEYCEVTGAVVTNAQTGKSANFLAALPLAWNGKFLFSGCTAYCGLIQSFPAEALQHGYASFATDDGHRSGSPFDASWGVTAPDKLDADSIADFYYRAVHEVTLAGKALAAKFYTAVAGRIEALRRSYFVGCSDGGREGMVEAARFPADFDGVVAGDPFFDMRGETLAGLAVTMAQLRSTIAPVPASLLSLVDSIVLARCDAADGVADGLIQNPALCRFNPAIDLPRCKANVPGPSCFTTAQIQSLTVYLSAMTDAEGNVIYPGYPVGDMNESDGLGLAQFTAFPFAPANPAAPEPWGDNGPSAWLAADNLLKYLVYADVAGYDSLTVPGMSFRAGRPGGIAWFHSTVPDATIKLIDSRTLPGSADAAGRLGEFIAQGRKLILYHGFSDGWITPYRTIQYYRRLAALQGGYASLQKHVRLFMVPGMIHCSGGSGPGSFDSLAALEAWVEKGIAPDAILATKYIGDNPAAGIARTMPLCKFPEMARYDGAGDVDHATSWRCPANDASLLKSGLDGEEAGATAPIR